MARALLIEQSSSALTRNCFSDFHLCFLLFLQGLGLAKQLAEKIHGKIGYEAPVEETKQEEKQTENEQRYEDEVEINDFPQTARWKVTSKVCHK